MDVHLKLLSVSSHLVTEKWLCEGDSVINENEKKIEHNSKSSEKCDNTFDTWPLKLLCWWVLGLKIILAALSFGGLKILLAFCKSLKVYESCVAEITDYHLEVLQRREWQFTSSLAGKGLKNTLVFFSIVVVDYSISVVLGPTLKFKKAWDWRSWLLTVLCTLSGFINSSVQ